MKQKYGSMVQLTVTGTDALLRFDRGKNRNAIDQETLLSLIQASKDLSESLDIHTVVLAGSDDIFSAGADLKDPARWDDGKLSLLERREMAQRGARLCKLWEDLPQLTVAAIEGAAIGGGLALALACDWRVASSTAFLQLPETKVGLNMGWGAIPRLVSLVGAARTKRIVLTCERLNVPLAKEWGLIDEVCDPGNTIQAAQSLLGRVECSPPIIRMTKESVNHIAHALNGLGSYMDADQGLVCRDSEEGVSARTNYLPRT